MKQQHALTRTLVVWIAGLLLWALGAAQVATATEAPVPRLPKDSRVPGGIAVVKLSGEVSRAEVDGKPVTLIAGHALVGIPLSKEGGELTLKLVRTQGVSEERIQVRNKHYRTQRLTINNQRQVDPNEQDMARIEREQVLLDAARARFNHWHLSDALFYRPVAGRMSDSFGSRRILNGQSRNPHSGLDIAAASGTPIRAPKAGEVALVGDFFFTGNTLIIDHGLGLLSLYSHLSEVDVEVGRQVELGEVIGKVGATGRATGAHLHWAIYLNQTAVDPQLLLIDEMPPRRPSTTQP